MKRNQATAVDAFLEGPESDQVQPPQESQESEMDVMQAFTESKARVAQLQTELDAEKARMMELYRRYQIILNRDFNALGFSVPQQKQDKRALFNPMKNLKISAKRSYDWSRRNGRDAEQAREMAAEAALRAGEKKYKALLDNGKLPKEIIEYVDYWYKHYDEIELTEFTAAVGS